MADEAGLKSPYLVLAEFLRQHPDRIRESPEAIAQSLGLEPQLVRDVLSTAQTKVESSDKKRSFSDWIGLKAAGDRLHRILTWIGDHPIAAVAISTGLAWLLIVPITTLVPTRFNIQGRIETESLVIASILAFTFFFHAMIYLVKGMVRYAWWGALTVYGIVLVGAWIGVSLIREANWTTFIVLSVAFLFLAFGYAVVSSIFSVLGGFLRLRFEESQRRSLSRQELLDRLLDVQERLREVGEGAPPVLTWRDHPLMVKVQQWPFLYGGLLSLIVNLAMVLLVGIMTPSSAMREVDPMKSAAVGILQLIFSLMGFAAQTMLAFLAGRIGKALLASLWFTIVAVLVSWIPIGPFGIVNYIKELPANAIAQGAFALLIGCLAGIGAQVESRAARSRQLARDEPSALVAEMAQLQMLLAPRAGSITVMVVDAAQSSKMKSEADPYVAEWSFREYQSLLSRIAGEHGGRVHSTAGDGAVIAFDQPAEALRAAQQTQREILLYNERLNRLPSPFRLRIGLHAGTIMGELDQVEFTEVIDIAAHIEGRCEIGGIAVSEVLADVLGKGQFIDSEQEVDGQRIWWARNPLGEA